MKSFAAYYAGLDPKPVNIPRPLSPDEWAEKCDRCHGLNGNSTRPEVPALAAQRLDYLEAVLSEVSVRRPQESGDGGDVEHPDARTTSTELAAHYARQKAVGRGLRPGAGQVKVLRTGAERAKLAYRSLMRNRRIGPMRDERPPHKLYRHYSELPYSMRVLFTCVLLILGLGYLFALLNIYFTYAGRAGGNPLDAFLRGHRRRLFGQRKRVDSGKRI